MPRHMSTPTLKDPRWPAVIMNHLLRMRREAPHVDQNSPKRWHRPEKHLFFIIQAVECMARRRVVSQPNTPSISTRAKLVRGFTRV